MKKSVAGALAAAFAAGAIGLAAPAQADDFEQPWDFYGDEIIELPFFGSIRFVDGPDVEPGFQGKKGHDRSSPSARTNAENPSG